MLAVLLSLVLGVGVAQGATLQQIGGFEEPIYVTSDPGNPNRLFVVERAGRIEQVQEGSVSVFADLRAAVSCCEGERGLLSIALAPDFDTSGRLFVDYIGKEAEPEIHVAELRASGDTAPLTSLRDDPQHPPPEPVEPLRRPAPVRPRRGALRLHRRRRRVRRPGTQRPERRQAAGQDPPPRPRPERRPPLHRPRRQPVRRAARMGTAGLELRAAQPVPLLLRPRRLGAADRRRRPERPRGGRPGAGAELRPRRRTTAGTAARARSPGPATDEGCPGRARRLRRTDLRPRTQRAAGRGRGPLRDHRRLRRPRPAARLAGRPLHLRRQLLAGDPLDRTDRRRPATPPTAARASR